MSSIARVESRIKELKNMTINMEVKKHAMQQLQDGSWKLTLTVHPNDMTIELLQAPMGSAYGLAMVPIDYDNPVSKESLPTEKPEGHKLRIRAVMLCKEESFKTFTEERSCGWDTPEKYIYEYCGIVSRAHLEFNKEAQARFKELDAKYKEWQKPDVDEQYADNFARG